MSAEYVADLLLMPEHYLRLGSQLPIGDPLDREVLRIAAILGSFAANQPPSALE
jgi:hypothetical protein